MGLTPIALAAALASSVSWAGFDAARKLLSAHVATVPLVVLLMFGQLPVFVVWWGVTGFEPVGRDYWLPGSADLVLNIAANVLFVQSVKVGELSTTIPLLSLTPAFTLGVASLLLGEVPGPGEIAAIAAIIVGAFYLNMPQGLALRRWWKGLRDNAGVVLMTLVAALWSGTAALDKYALAHAPVPFHAGFQCAGMAVVLGGYLLVSGRLDQFRGVTHRRSQYLGAVVLSVLAMGLQLVAVQLMYVAIMEAIKRAVGMTAAMLNGRILFGERITPRKLGAVALMTVGVVCLVL